MGKKPNYRQRPLALAPEACLSPPLPRPPVMSMSGRLLLSRAGLRTAKSASPHTHHRALFQPQGLCLLLLSGVDPLSFPGLCCAERLRALPGAE